MPNNKWDKFKVIKKVSVTNNKRKWARHNDINNNLMKTDNPPTDVIDTGESEITTIFRVQHIRLTKTTKYHVAITTYNRPESLLKIIKQIILEDVTIAIYDDCSDVCYKKVIEFLLKSNKNFIFKSNKHNLGKKGFSTTYNNIFKDISESDSTYFIQIPDDIILIPDFFYRATSQLNEIGEPVLNIATSSFHTHKYIKLGKKKEKIGEHYYWTDVYVDGAYIAKKEFFKIIGYHIEKMVRNWKRYPQLGSGTGFKIKEKYKKNMLQVTRSLVKHTGHDSVMNPEMRKTECANSELDTHPFNNKRVCFVGPSPELIKNGKKFGKLIDSYDIIIRTNGAYPVKEDLKCYYGSRTDVLVMNIPWINSPEFNFNIYENSEIKYIYDFGENYKKGYTSNHIDFLSFDEDLYEKIKKFSDLEMIQPFNGMNIVSQVLVCNPKELFICGVDNYANSKSHYDGYLPSTIKHDDVKKRQELHHKNTRGLQKKFFTSLLKNNLIKMDKISIKYYE